MSNTKTHSHTHINVRKNTALILAVAITLNIASYSGFLYSSIALSAEEKSEKIEKNDEALQKKDAEQTNKDKEDIAKVNAHLVILNKAKQIKADQEARESKETKENTQAKDISNSNIATVHNSNNSSNNNNINNDIKNKNNQLNKSLSIIAKKIVPSPSPSAASSPLQLKKNNTVTSANIALPIKLATATATTPTAANQKIDKVINIQDNISAKYAKDPNKINLPIVDVKKAVVVSAETHLKPTVPIKPLPASTLNLLAAQSLANNQLINNQQESTSANNGLIDKYGKVLFKKDLSSGLIAWVLEKNTKKIIMYTTPDQSIIISGNAWSTLDNKNINAQIGQSFNANNSNNSNNINRISVNANEAWKNKKFDTPKFIIEMDKLAGVKQGDAKSSAIDTVYIFFDPRCPYCKQAFIKSQAYIAKGKSIRWIPASFIGEDANNNIVSAAISSINNDDMLKQVMQQAIPLSIAQKKSVDAAMLKKIAVNKEVFFTLAKANNISQAGVPMAFFFNKRTAKIQYMTGLHADEVLADIFDNM
jgi:thiol:disulfide interchange protein DsbG